MKPNTPQFIISLAREIHVYNDGGSDLNDMTIDELKEVVIELKKRELALDIKHTKLNNKLDDLLSHSLDKVTYDTTDEVAAVYQDVVDKINE